MPVLGIIFLAHATNRYRDAFRLIRVDQAAGKMPKRPLTMADFKKRRALMLAKEAQFDELVKLPTGVDLGAALVAAMDAIERDFEPLRGQLPREYTKFESNLLEDILWISYFWSYLNKTGRAGFVMSSQASSAGHGEADVRRKLVEIGDVDVMISIRSNFFYSRTVPCRVSCGSLTRASQWNVAIRC